MTILTFYIIFAIINIIICVIIIRHDYNIGAPITLGDIGCFLLLIFMSILGTLYFIVCFFDVCGDITILQKKKMKQYGKKRNNHS